MSETKSHRKRRSVNSPFGKNLERLLKERGVKQNEAAALIGVAPSVINTWISNAVPQDLEAVLRLCKALNADFQEMLTDEPSTTLGDLSQLQIADLFEHDSQEEFSGLFLIEARRLRRKVAKT